MSLSPNEKYPGATEADPNYKDSKFKDNNPSTTNNGSPLKALDRNEQLALQEAMMNAAGFDYNGVVDTPQNSQMFNAYKAALSNGANLLSNHNFIIASPDSSQPAPSATPTSYPAGYEIFSGVFANETTGILNLTYIDGHVSFSGGDLYIPVANSGGIDRITEFVASVSDFDGKPRTRGVSYALVGDEYRVTVGVDALTDADGNDTPLGSVKFEQGKHSTGHNIAKTSSDVIDVFVGFVLPDSTISSFRTLAFLADGSEYNRADYPKLWNKVNGTAMLVSQSLINSDPETYAANYGDGDGSTTFTLPNYGLRPHLAAAGVFGAVGSTAEDHLQNFTGSVDGFHATSGTAGRMSGVFSGVVVTKSTAALGSNGDIIRFDIDASRDVRTGAHTEVNSSFLNFYIIHGESA